MNSTNPVFSVECTHLGNGWPLVDTPFTSESDAVVEATRRYEHDRAHPDFTRGGEDRFTWQVVKMSDYDEESGEYKTHEVIWSEQADERL